MLVGSVVDDKLGNNAQITAVSFFQEVLEVAQRPIGRVNLAENRDGVTVILPRGREKRQEPDRSDPKILQIIQLFREPAEIAHSIRIAVVKSAYVRFVDDGVFVPEWIVLATGQSVRRLHALLRVQIERNRWTRQAGPAGLARHPR